MKPNGTLFYQDEYEQFYTTTWETNRDVIDITTIIKQPYRWGKEPQGYISHKTLYRLGIISIIRQILKPLEIGYEVVAEGASQYEDYIQMNFPCESGPSDVFQHHLNHPIVDETEMMISDGSHWTDVDDLSDDIIWAEVNSDGSIVTASNLLEWIDVWT